MTPTLSLVCSRYKNTPPRDELTAMGVERLGYVHAGILYGGGEGPLVARSTVPLKRDNHYPVHRDGFHRRLDREMERGDGKVMLEVEVAGGGRINPHRHPTEPTHAAPALAYIAEVRRLVEARGAKIVAEYTNAMPLVIGNSTLRAAWVAMGRPPHHTTQRYGVLNPLPDAVKLNMLEHTARPGTLREVVWCAMRRRRRRPINVVISHINAGGRRLTPAEVAARAEWFWPRLTTGDRLIYWASESEEFETHLLPHLVAVREGIQSPRANRRAD